MRELAESVRQELAPDYVRPMPELADEEAYTVFCLESPLIDPEGLPITAETWLHQHRRQVASLLTQESDIANLSKQEADESTGRYLSYYQNDVVVIDWDAALIVDEPKDFDETLYVMEMANLQLAELEAYDRILDLSLDRAYRDLSDRFRTRAYVLHELREIRIDLARLSDELSNFTKFFGDWHLARIYESIPRASISAIGTRPSIRSWKPSTIFINSSRTIRTIVGCCCWRRPLCSSSSST